MPKLRTVLTQSAGGVVYRTTDRCIEIALCGRIEPAIWTLPKGTPHRQETVEETAVREVNEETGLDVLVETRIGSIDYWFVRGGVRFHKTVHHFLMRCVGGDVSQHDHEYDLVQWFSLDEALVALSYANERQIVRQAAEMLTVTDAGTRWNGASPGGKESYVAGSKGGAASEAPGRRED